MSVSTATAYTGNTLVYIKANFCDKITLQFKTRHDAAVFLQSMRKRVR